MYFCFLSQYTTSYWLTKCSEIRLSYDPLSTNTSAQYILQCAMTQILLSSLPYPKIAVISALFARRLRQPLCLFQFFLYQQACYFREDVRAVQALQRASSRFLTLFKSYKRCPPCLLQQYLYLQRTHLTICSSYVLIMSQSYTSIAPMSS